MVLALFLFAYSTYTIDSWNSRNTQMALFSSTRARIPAFWNINHSIQPQHPQWSHEHHGDQQDRQYSDQCEGNSQLGQLFQTEAFIHARWAWATLLAATVFLSIVLLAATGSQTIDSTWCCEVIPSPNIRADWDSSRIWLWVSIRFRQDATDIQERQGYYQRAPGVYAVCWTQKYWYDS